MAEKRQINEIISTGEATKLLGGGKTTVHDLIAAGKLQAFHERKKGEKQPWRILVLRREVEALAKKGWRTHRPRATVPTTTSEEK